MFYSQIEWRHPQFKESRAASICGVNIMKRLTIVLFAMSILFSMNAFGNTLFFEDFEQDLSNWAGKSGGSYSGTIVSDLLESDNALTFRSVTVQGDIFTTQTFYGASNNYTLSFDYLGTCEGDNCGGFIGYSYGLPDVHNWLGGTDPHYPDLLPDTGKWEHVSINFSLPGSFHIILEDYKYSGMKIGGDAFFDNILLESQPVPEPSTMLLFGSGLGALGLVAYRRKKK